MPAKSAESLLQATKREIGLQPGEKLGETIGDLDDIGQGNLPPEIASWSRVRLFEAAVTHEGLTRYLQDLASYQGKQPEREVKFNSYIAAAHLSTTLNSVVWDAIIALRRAGKVQLDDKQMQALEEVLKPPRDYRLNGRLERVDFDPLVLEDLRSEVQRTVFDQLDSKAPHGNPKARKSEGDSTNLLDARLPTDLEPIGETKRIDIKNAVELSKRYGSLKVVVRDGYMIWKFSNKPTLYLKDDSVYFSRKSSGGTLEEARLQVEVVSKLLATQARTCSLCHRRQGAEVAYLENGEVSLVCSQCERDPRVVRLIPSVPPSES